MTASAVGSEQATRQVVRREPRRRRGKPGRPSLADEGGVSPSIEFRLPAPLRDRAEQVAQREHKTVSAVIRDALTAYLESVPNQR